MTGPVILGRGVATPLPSATAWRPWPKSVFAWAGDVEAEDAEADGHQPGSGKVFAVLVQAQHENDPCDDPSVTKKAGTPGRNWNH